MSRIQPAFYPKASLVDDTGRSSGLYLIPRAFPFRQGRNSGEEWGWITCMVLTATGIAPELHRTSLFVRATRNRYRREATKKAG